MPNTKPLRSEGARVERKAVRAYLRRQIRDVSSLEGVGTLFAEERLQAVLAWVLERQQRYDKRAGGL